VTKPVETALPFDNHRDTPIAMTSEFTHAVAGTGVVDYLWLWDELSGWFPGELWNPQNNPAAAFMDPNSTCDPFVQAAFALASNPTMNIRLSTDAVRAQPAELLRRMLTLANCTEGKVVIAVGAGELRQTKPFGYKRAEGLKRLEDVLRLVRRLYDEPEPFSHEGHFWHFKNATIGTQRPAKRPEFWALGGGPVLLDIAARYADGFEAATPQSIRTPEEFSATVEMMREKVAAYGRDPDDFGFGIWNICVCHDDEDGIEQVLANPLVKYFAGQFGRLDSSQWLEEGETPVMPEGWHYAMKWAPFEQSNEEIERIVGAVTPSMARKAYHVGTPARLRELNERFVEAGATFIGMLDMTPLALGPAQAQESVRRHCEIFAGLKGLAPAPQPR
jgi:phthiodiolone/phenolphthiodiolone dimycocerosates ketoreductase